ncbi:MAG: phosphoenolpyruvate synthase [Deltaproteobacteria bacterium]|nr:phosphoenolpyruvate synthase [Deltaproteobacteria bacterium]MBW2019536.1 phosphoenolpyruvate synthase [Deltaproteobacteria bacterium]MBW2074350.1 phosphoenolpyruvate synthase [Deltaproteobacteria bacterium]
MKKSDLVLWFKDLGREDIPLVGGKCANLGELLGQIGVPVPNGFAVSAYAYQVFLKKTRVGKKIDALLSGMDMADMESLQDVSRKIRKQVEDLPMPKEIEKAILGAYQTLCKQVGKKHVAVAVRSSATAEDLPGASFAGQQDTFLNVTQKTLLKSVQRCWSSLFTPRAIVYRKEKGFSHDEVLISVAVQEMVSSEASGVMFTLEPVSGEKDKVIINASWGLGEAIVSGQVTPDEYVVEKATFRIIDKQIFKKEKQIVSDKKGSTKWVPVPKSMKDKPALSDEAILRLAQYGVQIENHYGVPQDIEWAVDKEGRIFILQARPETVHGEEGEVKREKKGDFMEEDILVRGMGVSPGQGSGKVKVLLDIKDISKFEKGDVLVTEMTTPDWVPAMKIASAVVTNLGGKTCHAAIVSRELGIPCMVGCENATEILKDGEVVTVDGQRGLVFKGAAVEEEGGKAPSALVDLSSQAITATKVYVNLSIPEIAKKVARETNADGVGLLRAEHLMLSIGKHPRLLLEEGGDQVMVDTFSRGVSQVAEAFFPRPVVYRFLDFKPDEFLELPGGEKYERDHVGPNPMIGYRGQYRYIKEDDIFRLELQAIRQARETMGFTNIWVMIPFVRTLEVFRETVKVMREEGLDPRANRDFQLWIMVEVPSACFMIEEFCREGIDGVSFGTNDLTMLVLGVDRNDASVQELYDERNLGVLRAIAYTISVCKKYGVTTSICGQAPSVYPDYLEFMIRCGCTSISVNPDTVVASRRGVAAVEQKIQLEKALGMVSKPKIAKTPMEDVFFWKSLED